MRRSYHDHCAIIVLYSTYVLVLLFVVLLLLFVDLLLLVFVLLFVVLLLRVFVLLFVVLLLLVCLDLQGTFCQVFFFRSVQSHSAVVDVCIYIPIFF